ncbi:MAG: AsmA-like C-terminal region-containing protein [Hyphomonadaceae bacterium]|nr:AsmA-like C-terminal region-containing protein [Hyphomonadaceae bacterium]
MRRKTVIGRFRKLLLALVACLLFAVLAPLYFADRRSDEPFAISSVIASPRDMHVLSAPVRLSDAPDLTLNRGNVYAYSASSTASAAATSSIVLDGAVFTLNAAGLRAAGAQAGASLTPVGDLGHAASPLIQQIVALGFDLITIRRGTLHIATADGTILETITDIQAEVTGRRKGQIAGRGSFMVRGQRLAFDATLGLPADRRLPLRWPLKASVKGPLLEASFDGSVDVADDLQLAGAAEVSTPSLRRVGRWFGLPLYMTEGFNATVVRGQLNWARQLMAVEKATVIVDGNEANGRLTLNVAGERPLIDATLDFSSLELTPYVEAARVQFLGFDLPTTSWSSFDFSLPLIRHVDADLRISARKLALRGQTLGQAGATISAHAGKLQADLTELEINSGTATAQVTVIMSEAMPRYALRGKIENFDAGSMTARWLGTAGLSGRATLTADLTSTGYSPTEIVKRLSGKSSLAVAEGRVATDLKVLRWAAKAGQASGWRRLAKSQTSIDQLEARALIIDGVAFADTVRARSGSTGLFASGRVGLADGNMDLRLVVKPNVPGDRPLQVADMLGGEVISLRGPWQEPLVRLEEEAAAPK